MLKRHGGIVGLSQDDSALDRLVTTTPHLCRLVRQYLNSFPKLQRNMTEVSTISSLVESLSGQERTQQSSVTQLRRIVKGTRLPSNLH